MPALRNPLNRKAHITEQSIRGVKPYTTIKRALPSLKECQMRMCMIIKRVSMNVTVKDIMNLYREHPAFAKRMGTNNSAYPIKTPMEAVRNQDKPPVYTAQVSKSRQIDRYDERQNASSFFVLKNMVTVGMNV